MSTCPNIHALSSCPITHPPCFYLKATMPCPCALISYSLISVTMCVPCVYHEKPMFLDITSNPNPRVLKIKKMKNKSKGK